MFNRYNYSFLEYFLFLPSRFNSQKLQGKFKEKTILITGASYGIGECVAYQLAKSGAHLILVARTASKLEEVKRRIENQGGKATIISTDLSKEEQVILLIDKIKSLDFSIDVFIHNAGKSIRRSIYDSLDRNHDFTRTMAINYHAPVRLILFLIPMLEKNKGQIINISAVNVLLAPAPYWAAYQASKTAFDQWFRSVASEVEIKTTSIYLPLVKTRMIAPTKAYEKMPAMSPEHVATIICKSILYRKRKYAPWWLIFGQLGSVLFRYPWELISRRIMKKNR